MENDLISRRALYQALRRLADETDCDIAVLPDVADLIREAPAVSPEGLRPNGHWQGEGDGYWDGELVYDVWECSECGYCIDDGTDDPALLPNFCPRCGARMEDSKDD